MSADERVEANRRMWDERVALHVGSRFYDVEGWKAGNRNHLQAPYEDDEIGPLDGRRVCHLQCHFGMDTLTLARRGATVVGVDFSSAAVAAARTLAAEVGLSDRSTFVQSTVEDARAHVDGDFDVVYTSWGALVWLPDLSAWARTIASLLRDGGFVYVADQHPFTHTMAWQATGYFRDDALFDDSSGSYTDPTAPTVNNASYEWLHTTGEIVTSLADAGLRIELLHEHPLLVWQHTPEMVQGDDGMWRLPGDPLPLSFSLKASSGRAS
jgi:2-polyprenyl-3-methyl-5-hydroxy-6-metoxy-1,4-benzoquinol methylase